MFIVLCAFVRPSSDACIFDVSDPDCSNEAIYNEQLQLWIFQTVFHFFAFFFLTAREVTSDPE